MTFFQKRLHEQEAEMIDPVTGKHIAIKVSVVSIIVNAILSVMKLFTGLMAHSGALVSDAIHSASDVFTTVIVIVGVGIASKNSDEEHPYGHERMECVAAILLAMILALIGGSVGIAGMRAIRKSTQGVLELPGASALFIAFASIVTKEWMYWYTRAAAKKVRSSAMMADACHHRSDAMSSVGALIGIFVARRGFPIFDAIASLVICIYIEKVSFDIFIESVNKMIDRSCDEKIEEEIRYIITGIDGVIAIDSLRTRLFGSRVYVDVEISADNQLSLKEAHNSTSGA